MQKTFNIRTDIVVRRNTVKGSSSYHIYARGEELLAVRQAIVQAVCCKRAYIRGAFLASGSMSDPSKSYHFEIVCEKERQAEHLKEMINSFGLDAKIVKRKKAYVVYLKGRGTDRRYPERDGGAQSFNGAGKCAYPEGNAQFCEPEGKL